MVVNSYEFFHFHNHHHDVTLTKKLRRLFWKRGSFLSYLLLLKQTMTRNYEPNTRLPSQVSQSRTRSSRHGPGFKVNQSVQPEITALSCRYHSCPAERSPAINSMSLVHTDTHTHTGSPCAQGRSFILSQGPHHACR